MGTPEVLGPYVIYERLGAGGMATVHRAEQIGLAGFRKQIALKRLLPHVAADPAMLKMFIHEARLASHLRHTNVAQVYDLGKLNETYFIAMEYVPGPTLTQIMKQCGSASGAMPVPIVLSILGQICDALDHAHNLCDDSGKPLGIIHRDVSPANIIVSNVGIVKLIDFGIAKAETSGVQTQTGMVKGKYAYIAPEYTLGHLDRRADLFGLGVIAHELLTTRRLFNASSDFETIKRLREMPIQPPSRWNPEIPPDVDDIVMTALQRDPARRWQSAAAMRTAITNAARSMDRVITNQQLYEWVEWAFGKQPRPENDTGLNRTLDTLTLDDPTDQRMDPHPPAPPPARISARISAHVIRRDVPRDEFVDEAATVAAAPSIETLLEASGATYSDEPQPFDDGADDPSTMPGSRRASASLGAEPPTKVDEDTAAKLAALEADGRRTLPAAPHAIAPSRRKDVGKGRPSPFDDGAEDRSTLPSARRSSQQPAAVMTEADIRKGVSPEVAARRNAPTIADDAQVPVSLPLGGPGKAPDPFAKTAPAPIIPFVPTSLPLGGPVPSSDRPTLVAEPPEAPASGPNNKARAIQIPAPLVPDPPIALEESGVVVSPAPPPPRRRMWPWLVMLGLAIAASTAGAYLYFVAGYTLDL